MPEHVARGPRHFQADQLAEAAVGHRRAAGWRLPRSATCSRDFYATPAVRTASAMRWASAALAAPGFPEGYVCPPAPVAYGIRTGVVWEANEGAIEQIPLPQRQRLPRSQTAVGLYTVVQDWWCRCQKQLLAVISTASNTCRSDSRQTIHADGQCREQQCGGGGHNQLGR